VTGDNTSASSEPVTSSSDPVASSSTSTPNDCHLAVTFGSSSSVSSSTVGSAFKEAAAGHAKHATQVGPQGTQGKAVLRQHGGGGGGGGGPPGYNKQPGSFFHKSAEEPPKDPSACEVQPGKETVIEINKDKLGLGLSIVGGSDTLLGAILIHEVYPDGAAAKDKRLKPGDQILDVNGEGFRSITHSRALAVLRQTPAKVKMTVFRDESCTKEDDIMLDLIDVELMKKSGRGLGLSIVGRRNGPGVYISDVVKGGAAEADGRLMQGDQILNVNGSDLKTASQEQAAALLKTAMGKIDLKIGRLKAGAAGPKK